MQEFPALNVQLFLNVPRNLGDNSQESDVIRRFTDRFARVEWPADRHLPKLYYDPRSLEIEAAKRACLHAKCIVVDRRCVFVSSANLTEAAQERNIEVGLLIRSTSLAERLSWHFAALVAEGVLRSAL
jgi:phosphatidylserine/phosphatidylglycerophosphate/cardiolipin synthase-like enzyme